MLFNYNEQRRQIDIKILWPACKETAKGDLKRARQMFGFHCLGDEAWSSLDEREIFRRIDALN